MPGGARGIVRANGSAADVPARRRSRYRLERTDRDRPGEHRVPPCSGFTGRHAVRRLFAVARPLVLPEAAIEGRSRAFRREGSWLKLRLHLSEGEVGLVLYTLRRRGVQYRIRWHASGTRRQGTGREGESSLLRRRA